MDTDIVCKGTETEKIVLRDDYTSPSTVTTNDGFSWRRTLGCVSTSCSTPNTKI